MGLCQNAEAICGYVFGTASQSISMFTEMWQHICHWASEHQLSVKVVAGPARVVQWLDHLGAMCSRM